jgi:hypothetical protein
MDEIDQENDMNKLSHDSESQSDRGPVDSETRPEEPVSRFVLLLVLLRVMVFAGLGIFYMKYCGDLKEDDSDSGNEAKPEMEQGAAAPKRRYILQRFIFRIAMFASKVLFFLLDLHLPRNIRGAVTRASSQPDDGADWGSLSSDSSEFPEQRGLTKPNGQERT